MSKQETHTVVQLAVTYVKKAVWRIRADAKDPNEIHKLMEEHFSLTAWNTERLILPVLDEIVDLVPFLEFDDEEYSDWRRVENAVNEIVKSMETKRKAKERERKIQYLENVEGRTPEEAAIYLKKAREMRAEAG